MSGERSSRSENRIRVEWDPAKKACRWLKDQGIEDASTQAGVLACLRCPFDRCILFESEPRRRRDGLPWGGRPG